MLTKLLFILLALFVFYKLTKTNDLETFTDTIEKQKINYLKLKETYIEPDASLELLYANYNGEEVGNDVWENKTLDQCTDLCNKMEGCSGFSRELVLDTEPAKCYPRNIVNGNCHSNRKGTYEQMQKAIKYNSFVKSSVHNVINNCIGDSELTLNREILIKSYSKPNEYLGNSGDSRIIMVDRNESEFNMKCKFRIEQGKDGSGTVAFLHLYTKKYIYRDSNNNLILKDITSGKTEDKQRVSFNLYDSSKKGGIMFRATLIEGETTDKFIMLNGKYLNIDVVTSQEFQEQEMAIFYIVDSIIDTNIITSKNNMPTTTQVSQQSTQQSTQQQIPDSSTTIVESFSNPDINLDTVNDITLYNNLFKPSPTSFNLSNYIQDTYTKPSTNSTYISVSNKLNNLITNKQLSTSLNNNQEAYNAINNINLEIESEISALNNGLSTTNELMVSSLDRMRISDIANDYFFLKTLTN